jgi:NADH:ubiquinone oxidoreductase subunit 6 (subunit J)
MLAMLARIFAGGEPASPLGSTAGRDVLAAQVAEHGTVGAIAVPMYGEYMILLQATAILLLIACVGAVVLAKRKV